MAKKPLGRFNPMHHRRATRGTVAVQVPRRAHFADSRMFVNGGTVKIVYRCPPPTHRSGIVVDHRVGHLSNFCQRRGC